MQVVIKASTCYLCIYLYIHIERERERQIDRWTDRQIDRLPQRELCLTPPASRKKVWASLFRAVGLRGLGAPGRADDWG